MQRIGGAGGVSLAVDSVGDGPPVLLVHGFPDSGRVWRNQVGPLVEAGRRAIVPDLRGYGASDRPAAVEDYRMTNSVADMVAVLDSLGVERADVIGHDWGAGVGASSPAARSRPRPCRRSASGAAATAI